MENKQTVSAAGTQENSIMKAIDQGSNPKGRSDIMTRRLKNRERQRRYRARKRLEAEIKKSSVITDITPQEEPQSNGNGNHNNFLTRIYCNRDWKKDARRAHALKRQEMIPNGSIDQFPKLTSEPKAACLASGNKVGPIPEREIQSGSPVVVSSETPRTVLSCRDWKAEARKKKN